MLGRGDTTGQLDFPQDSSRFFHLSEAWEVLLHSFYTTDIFTVQHSLFIYSDPNLARQFTPTRVKSNTEQPPTTPGQAFTLQDPCAARFFMQAEAAAPLYHHQWFSHAV